jgi:hypothetical protein
LWLLLAWFTRTIFKAIVYRIFEIPDCVHTEKEVTELTLGVLQAYAETEFNWDTFSAYDCYDAQDYKNIWLAVHNEIMNRPPYSYTMHWAIGVRTALSNK